MTPQHPGRKNDSGFTLTELAVVLVIVALLLGGVLIPLSTQVELRKSSETKAALAEIREALLGSAAVNGRLPCPAAATTASGTAGAGEEAALAGGICPREVGVLPWVTLGLSETDAWGRRYTYRVRTGFAQRVPPPATTWPDACTVYPNTAAFPLCAKGNIEIRTSAGGTRIAGDLPAVVISHGRNGNGAFLPSGQQMVAGADADELDNQLTNNGTSMTNAVFVSKPPTTTFDDELTWIPLPILLSRMIAVGRLP